ncbi:unnamed protein product [Lactuca virosa]|uniref:Uncharacterized protein n=1 Tax=Lactuca virosa TaxID=75947 RepID=A0AAU9NKN1_9ASTR|nr:unnamed protein product [Lactuca virosa]
MVTRESVNEMLGIPMNGKRIEQIGYSDHSDTWYNNWAIQFDDVSNLRMTQLRNSIVSTSLADMNFKMNFIVLFVNTVCESSSSGACNINILKHISSGTDIKSIDWCSYVLDCLINTSNSFEHYNDKKYFFGPSAYLVLLYLDSIDSDELKVERTRPFICYWSSEKIKYRENLEMTIGRFGFGDTNPPFVTEDCKQSFVDFGSDFEYNEESIECNLEDYEIQILKLLDCGSYCKRKMILLVDKAISKFPGIQSLQELKSRVQEFLGPSVSTSNVNNKNEISETYKIDDALFKKEVVVHVHYKVVKEETTHAEKKHNFEKSFSMFEEGSSSKVEEGTSTINDMEINFGEDVSDSQFWDNEEIQQALQRDIEIQTENFKKDMSNTKCDYFDNDEDFWNNPNFTKWLIIQLKNSEFQNSPVLSLILRILKVQKIDSWKRV